MKSLVVWAEMIVGVNRKAYRVFVVKLKSGNLPLLAGIESGNVN